MLVVGLLSRDGKIVKGKVCGRLNGVDRQRKGQSRPSANLEYFDGQGATSRGLDSQGSHFLRMRVIHGLSLRKSNDWLPLFHPRSRVQGQESHVAEHAPWKPPGLCQTSSYCFSLPSPFHLSRSPYILLSLQCRNLLLRLSPPLQRQLAQDLLQFSIPRRLDSNPLLLPHT